MSVLRDDSPQRSPEWFQARVGKLTGTAAKDMLSTIKSGEAAARRDLRMRLVCERLTGQSQEDAIFVNADMQRGIDMEPAARAAYEAHTGLLVQEAGFLFDSDSPIGYSPDGILADGDGILELKCPRAARHLMYLRAGTMPAEHLAQVTHGIYVSGALWCDFASYCPQLPEDLQLFVVRVTAESLDLAGYEKTLRAFLAEVEAEYQSVLTMANPSAQLRKALA